MKETTAANFYHEGALKSYFTIVQFVFRRYVANTNTATLNAKMRSVRQGLMTVAEITQGSWTMTMSCVSVHDEKSLNALFLKEATHPNRKTAQHWSTEQERAYLENLAQRADSYWTYK